MVGGGGEGGDKNGSKGAGAGDDLLGSRSYCAAVWEQELGGDRGHVKSTVEIPSSGSQKY